MYYFYKLNCACVTVYGYMHVSASAYGGQKRALDLLELESPRFVSCPTWVLGTEV